MATALKNLFMAICVCISPFVGMALIGYMFTFMTDPPPEVACVRTAYGVVCGVETSR